MAISGVRVYKNTYAGYTNSANQVGSTKENSVKTSTVELKTSTPGVTRTEQIKTGYSNVNDYSKYLQGKYSYMNTGTTSMQGVPTTVSVSSVFLKKCMNDPDGKIAKENAERKAKEKKAQEEKAAQRRAEKKAEEENFSGTSVPTWASFDIKA